MPTLIISSGTFLYTYRHCGCITRVSEVTEAVEGVLTYFREQIVFKDLNPGYGQNNVVLITHSLSSLGHTNPGAAQMLTEFQSEEP